MNIWKTLNKPIIGLAPMDGITDYPMRKIQTSIAKPNIYYTEFISVEGFSRVPEKFTGKVKFDINQRPIIFQLFGHTPNDFKTSIELLMKYRPDGFDINMGCPARQIVYRGGGGGLIGNYDLSENIILSCIQATKNKIPLSIKTRIGKDTIITKDWISFLCKFSIEEITLHGRLLNQGHSGEVNWNEISLAADIAHKYDKFLLGNGGIKSIKEGKLLSEKYNLDGFLIGQAALGNPWIFKNDYIPTTKERLQTINKHAHLAENHYGKKGFVKVRKHLAWYCKGIPNSKELKSTLVSSGCNKDVIRATKAFKP